MKSITMLRNPPVSYFNQTFDENPHDALFCSLNDININLLNDDLQLEVSFRSPQRDPRTQEGIKTAIYDYTDARRPNLFRKVSSSILTKEEHKLLVTSMAFSNCKTNLTRFRDSTFGNMKDILKKLVKEKEKFKKCVAQFSTECFEALYTKENLFVELYRNYYDFKSQQILNKYGEKSLIVRTGLPTPVMFKAEDVQGRIHDVSVLQKHHVRNKKNSNLDLSPMKPGMTLYLESYKSKTEEDPITLQEVKQSVQFQISIEALVFLLCGSEYIDVPSEAFLRVDVGENSEYTIEMNDVLPSKNIGVHTSDALVDVCREVFCDGRHNSEEIHAVDYSQDYFVHAIEDYVTTSVLPTSKNTAKEYIYVKWILELSDKKSLVFLTRFSSVAKYGSIKLEYKGQLGGEVLSKVNLIKEWFELMLIHEGAPLHRNRIHVCDFKTLLHQNVHQKDIEEQLKVYYKVEMPDVLGGLGLFLNQFAMIPSGEYLLRTNRHTLNSFILSSVEDISPNSVGVTLKGILEGIPSDLEFMTLRPTTPIDDTVLTLIHKKSNVVPCAFPPWGTNSLDFINDHKYIEKKLNEKNALLENKTRMKKARRTLNKKNRRRLRKQRKREEREEREGRELRMAQELKQDIDNDCKIFALNKKEDNPENSPNTRLLEEQEFA